MKDVDSEIRDIYQRFVNLEVEINNLRLKEGEPREPSTCFVDESVIVGRFDIMNQLMKLFSTEFPSRSYTESSSTSAPPVKKIRIVAITGVAGIGKTTLARLVYNDKQLQLMYTLKAWVSVSKEHGDVLESDPKCHGLLGLRERLSKLVSEFFIVLDEVSDMRYDFFDALINPLKSVATGGVILITTNNSLLVERMQPDLTINLKKLSDDDCWRVVEQHAFQSRQDREADEGMEDIARKIALNCKGLPLAARMVGCLLGSTHPDKWKGILDSDAWQRKDILPARLLSYNYLPSHLKRCFEYCSMFPASYIFEKETIVQLWIAEDFVHAQNSSLPQVSGNYFDELVSRSFFQQSNSNKSHFIMHSLIHVLARSMCSEFSISLEDHIYESTGQINRGLPCTTRYLSYLQKENDTFERFSEALSGVRSLRTFLARTSSDSGRCYLSQDVLDHLTNSYVCSMRVLSLSHYEITGSHLSNIGALILLRFLDLSYTLIDNLPESVCTLVNLQTLLVSDCRNLTRLPNSIGDLKNLLYLDLSSTLIDNLPESVCTLVNLKTLLVHDRRNLIRLPNSIGGLKNLLCLTQLGA